MDYIDENPEARGAYTGKTTAVQGPSPAEHHNPEVCGKMRDEQ